MPSRGASCVCFTGNHLVLYSRETFIVYMREVKKVILKHAFDTFSTVLLRVSIYV